jgi:glycosyltransferase involved in cell wall biosynthesis
VGGVQSWSERLAEAFAARDLGYDVRTLMVCVKPDAWRTSGASVKPSERMDLCVIDPMADHAESLSQVREAIENLAGGAPAIVIPNYTDITYAAAMQLRARGTRTIAVAHTDEAYYQELANTYCLWDGAVGVSRRCVEWMGEIELATRVKWSAARPVEWIPCVAPVAASPRTVEAEGPIKLAYVGRMVQVQKRISDLLVLVDELEARGVAYELHMVGDGVDLPAWRAALARRTLRTGRVVVHGRREAAWVGAFMRGIDVSVLVSEFEGTSVSMLEAMGAGVAPCVTAVRSGVEEWVTDGQTGVVAPIGAMGEMAERIARLARDRGELKRLGRAAWEKARRDASVEGMAAKYRALFDAVRARPMETAPTDLGLRLLERWRWNKDWAEEPERAMERVRGVLAEAGYKRIVNDAPVPGCDAVIVRTDVRPLSRVQTEQIELWRASGLGVVTTPHLRGRVADDAMSPAEAQACDRVRRLAARAASEGCKRISVYGTGKHTRRLAAIFDGTLPFVGSIDDAPPAWEYMFGLPIVRFESALEDLRPDAVILSSDAWESRMWERTEGLRRAGVRVIAVYGEYGDAAAVEGAVGVAAAAA